jgi:hypothetical protein
MNPISKCCGTYCACLMVSGIVFFAIMIAMFQTGNPFLIKGQTDS